MTNPPRRASNLKARLITAAVLLPLVLVAFVFGPAWFVAGFVLVCLTLCVFEIAAMLVPTFERKLGDYDVHAALDLGTSRQKVPVKLYLYPGIAILLGWSALIATTSGTPEVSTGAITLCALAALLVGTFSSKSIDLAAARAFGILISLCYGALPWLVVWHLYEMGPNARYDLLVMTVTWCGDTGGYFGGRYFGGKIFGNRKMAPVISPKKTWEGALSGLLLSVVGAEILNLVFLNALGGWVFIAKVALVGGFFAQLGDLVESTFKRFSGVKDSGVIIPGHGGFLDRVDGILFAAPVIWAMLYYFR